MINVLRGLILAVTADKRQKNGETSEEKSFPIAVNSLSDVHASSIRNNKSRSP